MLALVLISALVISSLIMFPLSTELGASLLLLIALLAIFAVVTELSCNSAVPTELLAKSDC